MIIFIKPACNPRSWKHAYFRSLKQMSLWVSDYENVLLLPVFRGLLPGSQGWCYPRCLCHGLMVIQVLRTAPHCWCALSTYGSRGHVSVSWYFNWLQGIPDCPLSKHLNSQITQTTLFSLPDVLETLILGLYGFLRAGPRKEKDEDNHCYSWKRVKRGVQRGEGWDQ